MNELFDKLILRFIFTLYICFSLYLYKYLHQYLYPTVRGQLLKNFYPEKNTCDTLHFFSRLLGIGIIYGQFSFSLNDGIMLALFDFLIRSLVAFIFYLVSLYVLESIVLGNFEYSTEIIKNKNMPYTLISVAHSIGLAFIINKVLHISGNSIIVMLVFWPLSLILLGVSFKIFPMICKLPFNRLMIQKNIAIAFAYIGIFWGWSVIIYSALDQEMKDIRWYTLFFILKILLSLIILPLFLRGITFIFNIQDKNILASSEDQVENFEPGVGIYYGILFSTACYLTSIITGQINFGSFYPVF